MLTEQLITSLVQDLRPRWSLRAVIGLGLAAGAVGALGLFLLSLGVRPDIAAAAHTVRFVFKFVVTLPLAVAATGLLFPLSRPGARLGGWGWALALPPVLLAGGVVAELVAMPAATWGPRLVGSNALLCSVAIPVLALAPLAGLLACLRYGAPTRPGLTGAVAGLAASGIAATLYASHCPDDSPLFVVTWYTLGVTLMALLGSWAGRRLLIW